MLSRHWKSQCSKTALRRMSREKACDVYLNHPGQPASGIKCVLHSAESEELEIITVFEKEWRWGAQWKSGLCALHSSLFSILGILLLLFERANFAYVKNTCFCRTQILFYFIYCLTPTNLYILMWNKVPLNSVVFVSI